MKKSILLLTYFLSITLISAQEPISKIRKEPAELARTRTDHMKARLNLSEEQSEKIFKLNLNQIKVEQQENAIRRERLIKHESDIKSVLDPVQLKMFEELRSKQKGNRASKRGTRSRMPLQPATEPIDDQK